MSLIVVIAVASHPILGLIGVSKLEATTWSVEDAPDDPNRSLVPDDHAVSHGIREGTRSVLRHDVETGTRTGSCTNPTRGGGVHGKHVTLRGEEATGAGP